MRVEEEKKSWDKINENPGIRLQFQRFCSLKEGGIGFLRLLSQTNFDVWSTMRRRKYPLELLFIADPPSPPQIHGDLRAEQKSGDKVKLTCSTDGGNPLPTLTWLRNDIPLRERSLMEEKGNFCLSVLTQKIYVHQCKMPCILCPIFCWYSSCYFAPFYALLSVTFFCQLAVPFFHTFASESFILESSHVFSPW